MDTPIHDFIERYCASGPVRCHMPGHKGRCCDPHDITEIYGSDELYSPSSIILESEKNAARLFGTDATLYSTEGSSQCVKAMLYLCVSLYPQKRRHIITAFRNVHGSFISAAQLIGFDIDFVFSDSPGILSCPVSPSELDRHLCSMTEKPDAVYVTSPDYTGATADISGLAEVAHKHGILLVVDNAHGAYLKFLSEDSHPITLGADMCCDSAHKTLPALTGGAYLHIHSALPGVSDALIGNAKKALYLFGSTSPSWLILESLDLLNGYLAGCSTEFSRFEETVRRLKDKIADLGWEITESDPFRITVRTTPFGYSGTEVAGILERSFVFCELCDPDITVLMLTPHNSDNDLERLYHAFSRIRRRAPLDMTPPVINSRPECVFSPREVLFRSAKTVEAEKSLGMVFAGSVLRCPPAVPLICCGERIDNDVLKLFEYYGIDKTEVVS